MDNENVVALVEAARREDIPLVYDIDDYLFDPWVMPYVEAFRSMRPGDALGAINLLGKCLHHCPYFTGSTHYLAEKAATLGKNSFVIHNGINETQIQLSRLALEQRAASPSDGVVRIGYFSGTRTHQADFRIVYPVLMALLRDEPNVRLVVVGDLDLGEFPGLAPFADHIDLLPLCNWRELPDKIARIDINLIPLEITPFNEGKSNLKYFEAGLLKVPSIASPTGILRESITHGHNGLLARTTEEWYDGLKELVARPDWREHMGRNAFDHVLRNYVPEATANEAIAAYRQIIRLHRRQRGIAEQALSIVILLRDGGHDGNEWEAILHRANELAAAGHAVTVLASDGEEWTSAEELRRYIGDRFLQPTVRGPTRRRDTVLRCIDGHRRTQRRRRPRRTNTALTSLSSSRPAMSRPPSRIWIPCCASGLRPESHRLAATRSGARASRAPLRVAANLGNRRSARHLSLNQPIEPVRQFVGAPVVGSRFGVLDVVGVIHRWFVEILVPRGVARRYGKPLRIPDRSYPLLGR